ncbi:Uncharacterized protein SCF082_LOCUS13796 [Durusdinium trenchii]|uniref:Uncharacterized protein n=1 Tax=Durusdinium trenchii TaxID=1381693 RepID=A0ABP0JTJ1_9DINO
MSLDTQVKDKCKHVQMTPIGPCDCKRVVPLMFRSLHYPEGWRSMPLDQWLRSVDNGKGYLLQYEQGLLKNYDNLEQIMELYVAPPGDDGKISIDQTFFADLTAGSNVEMKVGHKRMFEKWFKDHWNS